MADQYPEMTAFARAFAAQYKGFMKAENVTGAQIAEKLGRNAGYVSERINGKRALNTSDADALADLAGPPWSGRTLMIELAERVREMNTIAPRRARHLRSVEQDLPAVANDSIDETPSETDADYDV